MVLLYLFQNCLPDYYRLLLWIYKKIWLSTNIIWDLSLWCLVFSTSNNFFFQQSNQKKFFLSLPPLAIPTNSFSGFTENTHLSSHREWYTTQYNIIRAFHSVVVITLFHLPLTNEWFFRWTQYQLVHNEPRTGHSFLTQLFSSDFKQHRWAHCWWKWRQIKSSLSI